ncbi:hypothetical protein CH252_30940 [Rhodococcus sp. 06-1477-1B]|nr:hypothetical protein CH252_30940 [Rhodococcus sp. 06-1477-1B]
MNVRHPHRPGSITVVGEALVDIVCDRDGRTTERVGGSPLNVAIGLGRLGRTVSLVTQLGDDDRGDRIRAHALGSHVEITAQRVSGGRTSTAVATIGEDGAATYSFSVGWEALDTDPPDASVVHTGSLATFLSPGADDTLERFGRIRSRALTSFDPNVRAQLVGDVDAYRSRVQAFLRVSDIVKLSDEDAEFLFPGADLDTVADHILSAGAALAVVTRGPRGSLLRSRSQRIALAAIGGGIVDTIGAGDSYMAGLLHSLTDSSASMRDGNSAHDRFNDITVLERAGRFALSCAAVTVRRAGADLPWASEMVRA